MAQNIITYFSLNKKNFKNLFLNFDIEGPDFFYIKRLPDSAFAIIYSQTSRENGFGVRILVIDVLNIENLIPYR